MSVYANLCNIRMIGWPSDDSSEEMPRTEIDLDEDISLHPSEWHEDFIEYQIDHYTQIHIYPDGSVRFFCIF